MKKTEEDFWAKIALPEKVNYAFKNDRVIAETFKRYIPKASKNQSVVEVGCAPGKWLTMFHEELGYSITGIEYVDVAATKTVENFEILGIPKEKYNIISGDFFNISIPQKFDVVFSLGFVEHFENFDIVMDKHLALCKENNGYLAIGLPNFNGLNYIIQRFIDKRQTGAKLLPLHNLNVMNIQIFLDYAKRKNLDIICSGYIGGFERALFNTDLNTKFNRLTIRIVLRICNILFGSWNNRFTSSYLFFVFKTK